VRVDHKEAPLRVPTERQGAPTNVELKASDASANPYLSLAGLIAAGIDGIERGLGLPEPVDYDPGQLSDAERAARRIERLPATLDAALAALERDPVLLTALGEDLARALPGRQARRVRRVDQARARRRGRPPGRGVLMVTNPYRRARSRD
jgi:glutamine synthetase